MAVRSETPMECEEEEEDATSYDEDDDEEEDGEEEEPLPPNVVASLASCSAPESSSSCLSFSVNGRRVPLLPGGGSTELNLHFHPGGTSSGFVSVHPAAMQAPLPSLSDHTPIITGVVSGLDAHKVLNEHQMNPAAQQTAPMSTTPKSPKRTIIRKYIPKGPTRPYKCSYCSSQYKMVAELRGFICLCSPVINMSVNNLKAELNKKKARKRTRKRSRKEKRPTTYGTPSPPVTPSPKPPANAAPPRSLPVNAAPPRSSPANAAPPRSSPANAAPPRSSPANAAPPRRSPAPVPLALPLPERSKMVIMVDDFYYGCDPGSPADNIAKNRQDAGPYDCAHCPERLHNNITLMSHMKSHVAKMAETDRHMNTVSSCSHCFRHFNTPLQLEHHVESAHARLRSTVKCEICELDFGTAPLFLHHMKNTHKAGEMPYVCQVCHFRSSFYSEVWRHFEEVHANTANLMCPYCLKVLHNGFGYMQHFAKHQRKILSSCKKCRLHFLFAKERIEHQCQHHGTHIVPTQIKGLKLGTKVSVRTYSGLAVAEFEESAGRAAHACKVVDVEDSPSSPEVPRKKRRESLATLVCNFSSDEEEKTGHPGRHCMECLSPISKMSAHFLSFVRCSVCPFTTCCSIAYANHMIRDHTAIKQKANYHSMFSVGARLGEKLRCTYCSFCTDGGDEMAAHVADHPEYAYVTAAEPDASETFETNTELTGKCNSKQSSGIGGAFVPIGQVPPGPTPCRLSVKELTSPYKLSCPAAMTLTFLKPQPPTSPPATQQQLLAEWEWRVATWVMIRREQQLRVNEDVLLRAGDRALPEGSREAARYRRTVFRLCRQPRYDFQNGRLPKKVVDMVTERSSAFVNLLCTQIQRSTLRPRQVGFMDELSVFVDEELFSARKWAAFQLLGSPSQKPLFEVTLSALSDGTFLPPVVFFRGPAPHFPPDFPENVLLEANRDGFDDARRLRVWTQRVWRPCMAPHGDSLLMVDVHRGHATAEFKAQLGGNAIFIPAGCAFRLQPLDVCVKPVLSKFLQARWNHLVAHGGLDGLSLDQLALMLACWLSEVATMLVADPTILRRSFASMCHLRPERDDGKNLIRTLINKLNVPLAPAKVVPNAGEVQLMLTLREERQPKVQPGN